MRHCKSPRNHLHLYQRKKISKNLSNLLLNHPRNHLHLYQQPNQNQFLSDQSQPEAQNHQPDQVRQKSGSVMGPPAPTAKPPPKPILQEDQLNHIRRSLRMQNPMQEEKQTEPKVETNQDEFVETLNALMGVPEPVFEPSSQVRIPSALSTTVPSITPPTTSSIVTSPRTPKSPKKQNSPRSPKPKPKTPRSGRLDIKSAPELSMLRN
jgi:hypothetical protein